MPASNLSSVALLAAWEDGYSQPLALRALTLLAVVSPERSVEEWAGVSIGERDAGLLSLRERLFGPELDAGAQCPQCGERLEVRFRTGDVRALAAPQAGLLVEAFGYEVEHRLPTSADLLAIAEAELADPEDACRELLKRCIGAARMGESAVSADALPDEVVDSVARQVAEADPQAEVEIAVVCSRCAHSWKILFDIASYLWSELDVWAQRLLIEVHTLATAYGWSEREIVAMSPRRRQFYLELTGT